MRLFLTLAVLCVNLFASDILSKNTIVLSKIDLKQKGISAKKGNDIWGWTDPQSGKEYAIMGMDNKTSFIDISEPTSPIHIADIKTRTGSSIWRDIKVYKDHAYIVSEAYRHGMQIFDLKRLRGIDASDGPVVLKEDVKYKKFGNAHNIAINEETGYAYAVGTSTCDGGLHIINIQEPLNPRFVTCIGRGVYELPSDAPSLKHGDAYTHDVQCVVYKGSDSRFLGREICVASNEDTVNVVDVTDKSNPYQISVSTYNAVKYTHQGWLTEDHDYFLLGDELDESSYGVNTKTFIWDFRDLKSIKQFAVYQHNTKAIDHNMYVKGSYVYQANYNAGLRVLDISRISEGLMKEVAFMDPMPNIDSAVFEGVWSVFPYFDSGVVIVSGIDGTLYVTRPVLE
ncbi:MAG: choice-of-anchor B family protein [Bacteriovoracaceae bacterium]|nr:choice-of-anchor B family protein [Bacteriovoracaceae bacterium]